MTLHEHLEERFAELFAGYRKQRKRAAKRVNEEVVHDLRVASRRILEGIRVYRDLLQPDTAGALEKALKRWMKATGTVRDLDIALGLLEEWGGDTEGTMQGAFRREQEKRAAKLRKRLETEAADGQAKELPDPGKLVAESGKAGQGSVWDLALSAGQNGALALPLLLGRYGLHGDQLLDGESSPSAYHSFRLRTKRLRYTLESFERVYRSEDFDALTRAVKDIQTTLGALHDCEAAAELAQRLGGGKSKEHVESFGHFLEETAAGLRAEFHREWAAFRGPAAQRHWVALLQETLA